MLSRTGAQIVVYAALLCAGIFITSSAGAAGIGGSCGGFVGATCDPGLWCEPLFKKCGGANTPGKCAARPVFCTFIFMPVCGCDKKTYSNDCVRRSAAVQKAYDGACK